MSKRSGDDAAASAAAPAAAAATSRPRHAEAAAADAEAHPFAAARKTLDVGGRTYAYYDLAAAVDGGAAAAAKLPYSIRVLLESAVRNADRLGAANAQRIARNEPGEMQFVLSRVLLQDFTGVPALVDLAAMREAVAKLGGDPARIQPHVPVDLVIDHSVQVDRYGSADAAAHNLRREFERNAERFVFLKWGASAFRRLTIVPPGGGIVHQVNLEYLARVVFSSEEVDDGAGGGADAPPPTLYFDTLVGTDSHTPMVNGLGVLGWGVGGIEAEAAMLGQPMSIVLPDVVGYELRGRLPPGATATDLVLTIVRELRAHGVVGKFVEFYGDGVATLSIADRSTISNMAPEHGATVCYFPVDAKTLDYLRLTGRDEARVALIEAYCRAQGMFVDAGAGAGADAGEPAPTPTYAATLSLELGSIAPCLAGPKRPQDHIALGDMAADFARCLGAPVGFKGFALPDADAALAKRVAFTHDDGKQYELGHGSVAIAAITSCTNTSNPDVLMAAGLLAKRAVERGLRVRPHVKTSLAPGSGVVTEYLRRAGLLTYLEQLGFYVVGSGCTTCIGNSGPLPDGVTKAIEENDLVVAGVLSGNRNFEGRIHQHVRANYLASPPLVVAYALAGSVCVDLTSEPLPAARADGAAAGDVFMRDLWPSNEEIADYVERFVKRDMFVESYRRITEGTPEWNALQVGGAGAGAAGAGADAAAAAASSSSPLLYPWDDASTYIHLPPFFRSVTSVALPDTPPAPIANARCLGFFGDSITTDHISPAGAISRKSPAARYLQARGVAPRDFNSYGSRRGNDEVMARGTFANIRLRNEFLGAAAPKTLHLPSGEVLDVFDAAERYRADGTPLIIVAGAAYGTGSSRDWAAKGVWMQGVRAVIAVSYERIHRANLVLFGVLPLEFADPRAPDAKALGLDGKERFSIDVAAATRAPGALIDVGVDGNAAGVTSFKARVRIDTDSELSYFQHGGVLNKVIRQSAAV